MPLLLKSLLCILCCIVACNAKIVLRPSLNLSETVALVTERGPNRPLLVFDSLDENSFRVHNTLRLAKTAKEIEVDVLDIRDKHSSWIIPFLESYIVPSLCVVKWSRDNRAVVQNFVEDSFAEDAMVRFLERNK